MIAKSRGLWSPAAIVLAAAAVVAVGVEVVAEEAAAAVGAGVPDLPGETISAVGLVSFDGAPAVKVEVR